MRITAHSNQDALLTYGVSTNPSPLYISPVQGDYSKGTIIIVISNILESTIYCEKINLQIPIGKTAQDLTDDFNGIEIITDQPDYWSVSKLRGGKFTVTAKKGMNEITTDGVTIILSSITINKKVGNFEIDIEEFSGTDSNKIQSKETKIPLAKFPVHFYLEDFKASKPRVQYNEGVTLSWKGSDLANYTLLYDDSKINLGSEKMYSVTALQHTTNFILEASFQERGHIVTYHANLSVDVENPEVTATSLKVSGDTSLKNITIGGDATIEKELRVKKQTALENDLTVSGKTVLKSLTIGSDAIIEKDLRIKNQTTLEKNLNVSGATTLKDATIEDSITVKKDLRVVGNFGVEHSVFLIRDAVTLYDNKGSLKLQKVLALTDGFVTVNISNTDECRKACIYWVSVYANGKWYNLTGGNAYWYGNGMFSKNYYYGVPNSLSLPVKAGSYFYYQINAAVNEIDTTVTIQWVPMGISGEASYRKYEITALMGGTEEDIVIPVMEPPVSIGSRSNEESCNKFVMLLERIVDKKISEQDKIELADLLRTL